MRLGISSFTYNWAVGVRGHAPERPLSVFDLLRKAEDLGVRVLQIGDNLPLDRLSAAELRDISFRAADMGIAIEAGTRGIQWDHLVGYIGIARTLGSHILRTVIDTADDLPDEEEVIRRLRQIAQELDRAAVSLAVENHDRFQVSTLAGMVERAGSPRIGICLDTTNSFGAGEDPRRAVELLAPMALNVHVKDYVARRMDHTMGMLIEGRPAGQGQLDIPWLIGEIQSRGRDPNVILELWTGPEASLAETIEKENRWARESVEYLRGFIRS
jgi:sugar phosphate isomerase/epimerase